MKSDIFLSVRSQSTRLPGKALLRIKGKTILDHLIRRLKTVRNSQEIVLCTSINPRDDLLVRIANNNKIAHFRGSEDDKLDRYLQAAKLFSTDFIVVVDGDDLFCEPLFIEMCIQKFNETNADYISIKNAPVGTVPFCVRTSALEKVCQLKNEINTEIWGSCFTDSGLFTTSIIDVLHMKFNRPDIRLTLDYQEDFIFINKIFDALYQPGRMIALTDIIDLLALNPHLLEINKAAQQKYLSNQQKAPKVTLRK